MQSPYAQPLRPGTPGRFSLPHPEVVHPVILYDLSEDGPVSPRIETRRVDDEHGYTVHVYVPPRAECAHGEGPTTYVPHQGVRAASGWGVRIGCPKGKDCWLVKLEFTDE